MICRKHRDIRVSRRRGWTLIEMLVTVAVMGSMTGMAAKMLGTLLHSERRSVEHVTRLATISRLSRHFRADIHAAADWRLPGDNPQLRLIQITTADKRQIQYKIQPQGVLRTEQHSGQPTVVQDLLRLKGDRFRIVESSDSPRILTLIIETPEALGTDSKPPTVHSRVIHIEALVGRDFREP